MIDLQTPTNRLAMLYRTLAAELPNQYHWQLILRLIEDVCADAPISPRYAEITKLEALKCFNTFLSDTIESRENPRKDWEEDGLE